MNRKKLIWRITVGIMSLAVMTAAAILGIVHTDAFRRFVLKEIVRKAETSLGVRLSVEKMEIDWRPLVLDFYGITLHGKENASSAPLFAADRLRVGLKIISLLRANVDLAEIIIDRPVAHLYVDSNENSNLPRRPAGSSPRSSSPKAAWNDLLNLAIQHLEINSGRLFYNDAEMPLSAELLDFRTQIYYNRIVPEYRGILAYAHGRVAFEDFKPIAHGLQLTFEAGRAGMVVDPITVTADESTLTAHAKLADFDDLHVTGTYDGVLSTEEVLRITNNGSIATGLVSLAGRFAYHHETNKSWAESTTLDGKLTSPQIRFAVGQKSVSAQSLRGEYRMQDGNLHVRNVEADSLGGRLTANYDLLRLGRTASSRLGGSIQNASLEKMNDAIPGSLQTIRLVGRVDGTLQATWSARIQDAVARLHVIVRNPNGAVAQNASIPLSGLIDAEYDGARQSASFGKSYVTAGSTSATVSGVLSKQSRLNAEVSTSDLHELGALVSVFAEGSASSGNTPWLSQIRGSARFEGQVLGSPSNPRVQGRLSANNLEIQDTRWRLLRVNLDAASTNISLRNGSASDSQSGQLTFSLDAGLRDWSFSCSGPLSVQLTAKSISIDEVQHFMQTSYPVSGMIAANISVHGSEENPEGQGSLQISRATAWNEPLDDFAANFHGDGNSIQSNIQVAAPAGHLTAEITYQPRLHWYDAVLRSTGVKLDNLQSEQIRSLGVSGSVMFSAAGHGSLSNPQLTANLQIPQLRIRDWGLSDVQAQLNCADRHANFILNSKAEQTSIQAKGEVALSGEYAASASMDIHEIPVAVILAKYLTQSQKIQGEADMHADLEGPLKNPQAIVAELEIPKLNFAYQATNLALVRPLKLKYAKGLATLEEAQFRGTGTNLTVAGTIPVKSAQALNVAANGTIDLSLLQGFAPDVRSSGHLDLNLSARGELKQPAIQGQIHLVDARLAAENIPVGLEGVNGLIQVSGHRMDIAQFSGAAGGGTISAHGFMTYGEPSSFNLTLDLQGVRLRYPEGIRSIWNGNLALSGSQADSHLTGRIFVGRVSFTQQFDLANFLSQFGTNASTAPSSPLARNMKLNIAAATAQEVSLTNSKVSVDGSANLTVIGTLADPVVLGRTTLTNGEMFFKGKRYEIQSGTIEFANPVRTTPVLNLNVATTVQQYNIRINFVGPLNQLRTNYTSDPPLPSADIINLVAFGKTSAQAASSPSTPATLGAESVLAQGVTSQVSEKIERLAGISQLTIDPLAGNSQTNPGSRVAIQQRISGSVLLTFSTDVTSTQNQSIQVQYQAKKNLSISVLRDQYGGYAADVRIHKSF